jgi:hypothetical protein
MTMGGKTPETCSAANKRQDNKLENCYNWLVNYLNCTMMHELTNLKKKTILVTWQSTVFEPPEDGLNKGPKHVGASFK